MEIKNQNDPINDDQFGNAENTPVSTEESTSMIESSSLENDETSKSLENSSESIPAQETIEVSDGSPEDSSDDQFNLEPIDLDDLSEDGDEDEDED
jgi:hypothetical protein